MLELNKETAEKVISDIKKNAAKLRHFSLLMKAYNGNDYPLFQEKLRAFEDKTGYADMELHYEAVNFFTYAVNKLSQPYNYNITRKAVHYQTGQESSEVMKDVEKLLKYVSFKEVMNNANKYCNATRSVMVEAYHNSKYELCLRALSNDTFWVYTSDSLDPTQPEVIVKFISDVPLSDLDKAAGIAENKLYYMYTDTAILKWESAGRGELVVNPLGFVPFRYINYDSLNLVPEKDMASESLAIGPTFDQTKLNVATWHQGHPKVVIYEMDIENSKVYNGSDGAWVINSKKGAQGGLQAKVDIIPSKLEIDKFQESMKFKVENWLRTKNVPVQKEGTVDQSALAMLIQGADTLEARKSQITTFRPADEDIVEILIKYHNWLWANKTKELPKKYPLRKSISEDYYIETTFELPSVEAEQFQKAKGEDVKVGQEVGGKSNGEKGSSSTEEKNSDTSGN